MNNTLYIFSFLIFILGVISYIFYKQIVGWIGEYYTRQELKKLPKDKYKILNNILINVNGQTHQIDHVIISSYGIFSIETKQYNGYITGGKFDKKWIRHAGKNKILYTNPILQNYGHCKALAELLNISDDKVFNIVCIPSRARLNIKHDGELVRWYELNNKIMSYQNMVFNNVSILYGTIKDSSLGRKERKDHIKYLRQKNIRR